MSSISFASVLRAVQAFGADETNLGKTPADGFSVEDPGKPIQIGERAIRITFWLLGLTLAVVQTWSYRHAISADGVAYLDMSDGVSPISNWHRLINGVWSPLYPLLLGLVRMLNPTGYGDIVTAHFTNIAVFLFTLWSFDFLLRSLMDSDRNSPSAERGNLPRWTFLTIAYTIFLWSCIGQVTFKFVRADLLMDALAFLAVGVLVRIKRGAASWPNFIALGTILGLAYLSKAPMLVIGLVMLASTLTQWRQTLLKTMVAGIVLLGIGSFYYVPLSQQLGHFTLGESGAYNYLFHVNRATLYSSDQGSGVGKFQRNPTRIYNSPPTYEFHMGQVVTYPHRFDPSYWTLGMKPRFKLGGHVWAMVENFKVFGEMLASAGGIMAGLVVLFLISGRALSVARGVGTQWPVWILGIVGLAMYTVIHVEERYVAVFFCLLWLGVLAGMNVRRDLGRRIVPALALGMAFATLGPVAVTVGYKLIDGYGSNNPDPDIEAARQLKGLGIGFGCPMARISSKVNDLGWARGLHATIVAEVDIDHADEFWSAGQKTQDEVLEAFGKTGAKMVVAHVAGSTLPPGWRRLGRTPYWIHWLG